MRARIATEYSDLIREYSKGLGKRVEILKVLETLEVAPRLFLAQIIVDVSSTGETLWKNKLKVIATILDSSCRLACNRISYRIFESEINDLVDKLRSGGTSTK